jgi:cellulose synthase/poly-beta-1,6-N-acetylglucosamine synthase-like glycosyltransferase
LEQQLGAGACRQLGFYAIPEELRLSVVIPVYNEERTLRELVDRVQATPYEKELVLVDDCSKDSTPQILAELEKEHPNVRVFRQSCRPVSRCRSTSMTPTSCSRLRCAPSTRATGSTCRSR